MDSEPAEKWPSIMMLVCGPGLMFFGLHGREEVVFVAGALLTLWGLGLLFIWLRA